MDPQGCQTLEPSPRGSREEKRCAWKGHQSKGEGGASDPSEKKIGR
jgi:hypothetical protein